MEKLDRLGWADGISLVSYGVRVGVRVNDPTFLKDVIERLPHGSKASSFRVVDHLYSLVVGDNKHEAKVRRFNLAYWNLLIIERSRERDDLLEAFESHVQLTVAEYAHRRVFVHAGVVGWNGRAILIPGMSYSGKTTLVEQLIRAGATYYSDEYAVLDERGRVHPYPRPLGIRLPQSPISGRVRPEEIGADVGSKPLRVGLVLSTYYKNGAQWRPRKLTQGQGVLELMSNTVSARSQPGLALTVLPAALKSARILKGVRGEADETVDLIRGLTKAQTFWGKRGKPLGVA